MPTLTFIEHDGTEHKVSADIGQSVMQAATFASVPGIPGSMRSSNTMSAPRSRNAVSAPGPSSAISTS